MALTLGKGWWAMWLQLHAEGSRGSLLSLFSEMHKIRKPMSQGRKVDADRPQILEPLRRIIPSEGTLSFFVVLVFFFFFIGLFVGQLL